MPLPRIAIVGRPNVGKSSLLNMLAAERVSIVDDQPGVTRDRVSIVVDLEHSFGGDSKPADIIDTGGYGVYVAEGERYDEVGADLTRLTGDIEKQIATAIADADIILFAIDCQVGITPQDEAFAKLLRERRFERASGKQSSAIIRTVATKCDGPKWEAHAYELSALGFDEPLMCSARNNYMRRAFTDALYEMLPDPGPEDERIASADLRVAIVGRRNVGKSTLINNLAGEDRVIVSEIAGTTRDAVDVRFDFEGRSVVAIDTAGLRRKKSFQGPIEWYALDRAERAIKRADVVIMMLDAAERVSQVDDQLAQLINKSYKPAVVVLNKWDTIDGRKGRDGRPVTPDSYRKYLDEELKGLRNAPVAIASATSGLNVSQIIDLAFEMHEQASQRVPTGELNRIIRNIIDTRGPTNKVGTQAKVFFIAQVATNPPTIVLVVNRPDLFTSNYQRFLMNRLRETLPFEEVPINLVIRAKRRDEKDQTEEPTREFVPRGVRMIDFSAEDLTADLPEGVRPDDILHALPNDPAAYFDEENPLEDDED